MWTGAYACHRSDNRRTIDSTVVNLPPYKFNFVSSYCTDVYAIHIFLSLNPVNCSIIKIYEYEIFEISSDKHCYQL